MLLLLVAEPGLPGQRGALLLLLQAALLLDPPHTPARNVLALGVAEVDRAAAGDAAAVAVRLSCLRPLVQVWQVRVRVGVVYRARHKVLLMVLLYTTQGDSGGLGLSFISWLR